ncbi:histidine kinase [Microbacterium betulae]|uniref:histidine kinase n=1 Tax=Microbacterium betulae TaxID=2981139 RepID=A0AA97I741_9MICO|nr:histidine kinase [Microbacterium sp. AB]WOF23010.1 histidine kinase [Microbacterium sp. AB]
MTEHDPASAAELALPRPPGAVRRWFDAHPRTVDAGLVLVSQVLPGAATLIAASLPASDLVLDGWSTAGVVTALVAGGAALMVRRRMPFVSAVVCAVLSALPDPFNFGGAVAVFIALYSLGVYRTPRRTWIGYGVASAVTLVVLQLSSVAQVSIWATGDSPAPVTAAVPNAIVFLVPTLLGISVGNRRRYVAAIIARASDLARERDQRARLAVADERARIAREMHDIVSHSLTVMVTLSEGAAAQAEAGNPRAPDVMRTVAETGRASLAEMRRLLGVLRARDQSPDLAPQPGGADLDALVARFRETGLPVRLTRSGPPVEDRALQLTTFRIVQEGLTNALRHAPGARRVEAIVRHDEGAVVVEVVNDPPARPGTAPSGRGSGLIGVRERAALHDGAVEAGPTPAGGWRLRTVLKEGSS